MAACMPLPLISDEDAAICDGDYLEEVAPDSAGWLVDAGQSKGFLSCRYSLTLTIV